jgi:hypothetical protein
VLEANKCASRAESEALSGNYELAIECHRCAADLFIASVAKTADASSKQSLALLAEHQRRKANELRKFVNSAVRQHHRQQQHGNLLLHVPADDDSVHAFVRRSESPDVFRNSGDSSLNSSGFASWKFPIDNAASSTVSGDGGFMQREERERDVVDDDSWLSPKFWHGVETLLDILPQPVSDYVASSSKEDVRVDDDDGDDDDDQQEALMKSYFLVPEYPVKVKTMDDDDADDALKRLREENAMLRRLAASKVNVQKENDALKRSILVFRAEVKKRAHASMAASLPPKSVPTSSPSSSSASGSNAGAAKQRIDALQRRVDELEKQCEKQAAVIAKHKARWSKLKARAREKMSESKRSMALPPLSASSSLPAVNRTVVATPVHQYRQEQPQQSPSLGRAALRRTAPTNGSPSMIDLSTDELDIMSASTTFASSSSSSAVESPARRGRSQSMSNVDWLSASNQLLDPAESITIRAYQPE